MFATLEFVMVSGLFLNLCLTRGAQLVTWAKGALATAETDVKKVV